jgi:putative ATP-binding cassette transporter
MPGLLIAPLVFRGILNISAFSQAQNAWRQLGSAFAFVGEQATTFAEAGALIGRLHDLQSHCARDTHRQAETSITRTVSDHLATEHLTILTPGGERTLIRDLSLQLSEGRGLIVIGPSGVGKSSLLRGLAGLWTRGSGSLMLPPKENVTFLPQRPYMSLGTLREQLTYPSFETAFEQGRLQEILESVKLGHVEQRFGGFQAILDWAHVLSPGEQQRLAFGRVLLRRPNLVILDEATSAIDVDGERLLYDLLRAQGCSYLSVAHRVSLYPYHDTLLELKGEGAWELHPILHAQQ